MPTTKKQQMYQREQHVLSCARQVIASHGLIGLKMPNLAKTSEISIGALYRHFESREDLITALAHYSLQTRYMKLKTTIALFEDPIERIVAITLLDFLFNVSHQEAFQVETQCTNAAYIELASSARRTAYRQQGADIAQLIEHTIAPVNEVCCSSTTQGIWCLVSGMSLIWYNEARCGGLANALSFFRPHLMRFLNGYLPKLDINIDQIHNIEHKLLARQSDWHWPINGDSND